MARKYLSFDIETAKEALGEDFNWKPHRPQGIRCLLKPLVALSPILERCLRRFVGNDDDELTR